MISKRRYKELSALQIKKFRTEKGLFLVEGEKMVDELFLSGMKILSLIATEPWIYSHNDASKKCAELIEAKPEELKKISSLKTPNQVLAVVRMPEFNLKPEKLKDKLTLVLDDIQDPGNLGTILRLSDWFGIENIICSDNTVDVYNPKVVQSSMGSIFRVRVYYTNLTEWLAAYRELFPYPVYGAFLEGENIYEQILSRSGLIILGNESQGISPGIEKIISHRLFIPRFPGSVVESLNVSTAAAIICSEFRRRG